MAIRIAVVLRDRCQPRKCSHECYKYCPPVRNGVMVVEFPDKGGKGAKPTISEDMCVGCGICVHKCPMGAIKIIQLPDELEGELIHQFGENGFRLFRLPCPRSGAVIGLLGPNGIGKTTIFSILSGAMVPNLGELEAEPSWDRVLEKYAGTELNNYLKKVAGESIRTSVKPQYVDKIPAVHKGRVKELLRSIDQQGHFDDVVARLDISGCLDRDLANLSGGELQRVAISATMLKDADIYFFDEPSSYLDIFQRLKIAKVIESLAKDKLVMIVEHDLAVLDFLASEVHLLYGDQGAYGIVAHPRPVRSAINTHLGGFMREENVRFRDTAIVFEPKPPREDFERHVMVTIPRLSKRYTGFTLDIMGGDIHKGEVIGIVGPNATGKTTFVRMLGGHETPDLGTVDWKLSVSYKPQYIKPDFEGTVEMLINMTLGAMADDMFYKAEIERPLDLMAMFQRDVVALSGGELQRLSIGLCLARDADLYLLDEPSAYLDAEQRMVASKTIRRVMEKRKCPAFVVDHDVYFIDMVSDSLMVFSGKPSVSGVGEGPFDLRTGMNRFLKDVDVTFRRDGETNRPRINKEGSRLDRVQKSSGEYYYAEKTAE